MRDRVSILPLHVEDLAYEVGGRAILSDVNFEIRASTTTALIGANGAGKSVLLRLCHGLLSPSRGHVRWAGTSGAPVSRRHAMVFQKPLMLRRSARANLHHVLAAAGYGFSERRRRSHDILERFRLTELADRPARALSGGEQQRLAIARAWALDPEVLFLDEPTAHLDPGATLEIEDVLGELASEGRTLVIATHDFGQARRLADRVLFLVRGRLIEDAVAVDFFAGPASAEARAFLSGHLVI